MSKTNPAPIKQKATDLLNSPVKKDKYKLIKSSGYGAATSPKSNDTGPTGLVSQKTISESNEAYLGVRYANSSGSPVKNNR